MKVEQILQSKGSEVFTVQETDTMASAVSALNARNIGAVIVKDKAEMIVGILSERDVVRRLGGEGASVLDQQVSQCMTRSPFTCSPEASVDEVMAEMTNKRIRHLPVCNGKNLVGVISIGDVVKRKIEQTEQEAQALKEYIAS